jgi:hypothetical protein
VGTRRNVSLISFLSAAFLGKSTPYRRPVQEKSENVRGNWQFASLVPFHVLFAASQRVRFETQNSEGIHQCCCLSATVALHGQPFLLSAADSRRAHDLPASRLLRCGSATSGRLTSLYLNGHSVVLLALSRRHYILVKLHKNSDNREFRAMTGGVFHSSGGAAKDTVPFGADMLAPHVHELTFGALSARTSTGSSHPAQRRLPIWPLQGKSIASLSSDKTSTGKQYHRAKARLRGETLSATLKRRCPLLKQGTPTENPLYPISR